MNKPPSIDRSTPATKPLPPAPKRRRGVLRDWSDKDFASDLIQAETQSVYPVASWVLYIVVLFFAIALIWAAYAQVDEAARGEGTVIPSSQVQVIQNLEGGILKKINVHEGDICLLYTSDAADE